jgi:hypothetical protein
LIFGIAIVSGSSSFLNFTIAYRSFTDGSMDVFLFFVNKMGTHSFII